MWSSKLVAIRTGYLFQFDGLVHVIPRPFRIDNSLLDVFGHIDWR